MGGATTSLLLHVLVFKGTTLLLTLKGQGLKEMRQQEKCTFPAHRLQEYQKL